ncbi:MAG TPA: exo-alpha-sialidase [Candidatus Didemnitutus sp.]|nr:exo-alpha-sialidase [Candidatus Didemnitutus sp.]
MIRPLTLLCAVFLLVASAMSQGDNPHVRHMERAHPTPLLQPKYDGLTYMVPMLTEKVYPSLFLNVNMIVEETDPLPAQNESSIAVNPRNPRQLIGSAVDYRLNSSTWAYYSTDAGATWENLTLGTARIGWTSSNDPSVCFDHNGKGYLVYGGFKREGNVQFGENGIFISSTTDGGKTWGMKHTAVIIHTGQQTADSSFEDKYYIHADTASSSPNRGHLYIPWKRVVNRDSSTQIVISKSTDQGATWSAPVNVSDRFPRTSEDTTFGQSFPLARTGPDGSVHLVWNSGTEDALRYARSMDGGTTWTAPRIIHTYKPFGTKSTINGQTNSRVKGIVRAECYPTLTVDNTGGTRNGWLYLTWAADNYPNVYFSRSTDNGTTWSPARIVHSDTTNDQFWSWISLDPTSGEIAIMYSDSRDDVDNILVNTYVSWSSDGGTTWIDRRVGDDVNDLRRNPFQGNTFAGDYSGCDFYNGIVYPSWVDMRNTYVNPADNDVFTAIVSTRAPSAPQTFAARTVPDRPTEIDLSWSAISTLSFGQPLPSGSTWILHRDGTPIDTLPIATLAYTDRALETYRLYRYVLVAEANSLRSAERTAEAYAGGARALAAPVLVQAHGTDSAMLVLDVRIPTVRADGTTAIVNLDSLSSEASEVRQAIDLAPTDTGAIVRHTFAAPERGWYRVRSRVMDTEGNTSGYSDTAWVFTGDVGIGNETGGGEPRVESYDDDPRYHRVLGAWDRAAHFYRTPPASYAHSSNGPYLPNRRDTVILPPVAVSLPLVEGYGLVLRCHVAAFVDPSDTVFLETSMNGLAGPWETVEWWNASRDARWADTTKGDDAWRAQYIPLRSYQSDTMHMRLRFRSNASRQSDGFYIDDVSFDIAMGVDESEDVVTGVSPNPTSAFVNATLQSDAPINRCVVVDAQGTTHNISWYQSGSSLVANVQHLPQGVYSIAIDRQSSSSHSPFLILR